MVVPIATLVNVAAVLVGGFIGLKLKESFPERFKAIVFQAIGLGTLVIGFKMALQTNELLFLIFSLILGAITGELIKLQERTEKLASTFEKKLTSDSKFAEGLVSTFVLFCLGSMTILGAIDEGIHGDRTLILTKSVLDGFTAIALASYYGRSVLFSVIPLFIFQAGLTVLASGAASVVNEQLITELSAVGGVMIIAISLNMLNIKEIKVLNFLPALLFSVLFSLLFL